MEKIIEKTETVKLFKTIFKNPNYKNSFNFQLNKSGKLIELAEQENNYKKFLCKQVLFASELKRFHLNIRFIQV
jgi:hypothetical protein